VEADYRNLKAQWLAGERRRDLCLQLLFFAWMHWADPSFVTGLTEDPEANALWHDIFVFFGGERSTDAEFLFVSGVMAEVTPWGLGDEKEWRQLGTRMVGQAMTSQMKALSLSVFDNRGKYGILCPSTQRPSRGAPGRTTVKGIATKGAVAAPRSSARNFGPG